MATRFYLPASGAAPVSVAIESFWTHTNSVSRACSTSKTNTALASTAYSPDGSDHLVAGTSHFVQFVSTQQFAAQTIAAQAFKFQIQGSETNAGNNLNIRWKAYFVSADGTTKNSTALVDQADGTEFPTGTLTNRGVSGTTNSMAINEGDRLVIEIGMGGTPTNAGSVQGHNGTLRFGDNQATDLPEDNTDQTTTKNPWAEWADNWTLAAGAGWGSLLGDARNRLIYVPR